MATTMTLAQLRTAIRQRADMVNSQFITDAELNSYINQSYFELYDLLIQKYGDNYYVADPAVFSTNGQTMQYLLPNGTLNTFTNGRTLATNYQAPAFYKLYGVDLQINASPDSWVTIRPFNFADRNRYAVPNFQSFYGVTNLRYRLNGEYLWLTPIPAGNQKIQIWYAPRLSTLTSDTDTVDGISGWTEYIIIDCVIKCNQKEETDPSVAMAQKVAIIQRIESAAENRDAANPSTVADVQYQDFNFPTGSGSGLGGFY